MARGADSRDVFHTVSQKERRAQPGRRAVGLASASDGLSDGATAVCIRRATSIRRRSASCAAVALALDDPQH